MDKLKPILEQKFWIFFGVVFIMPLVGYFMTKGPLAAEIEARWKVLDGVFGAVPAGTGSPNDLWAKNAKDINAQCELNNKQAHLELFKAQAAVMRFPNRVAGDFKRIDYFKAPTAADQRPDKIQQKYGEDYPEELRNLWLIVDPLDDGKNFRESNARRKVAFAMADLQQASWGTWGESGPDFPKIWAAQEDIWLQTELLNAIKRINQPCNSQHEAYIKQILKVVLFGGTKAAGDAGAAAQTSVGGGGGGPIEAGASMFGAFAGTGGGAASGSGAKGVGLAEINLSEEFTASIEVGGGPVSGTGNSQPFETSSNLGGPASGGTTGAAKSEIKRYIDDDEKLPYKRRGFSITLVMDHRQVPHLLAELMNSPFPVEIVRVHQSIYAEGASPSGGGPGAFAGAGGFPGGATGGGLFKASPTDGAGTFSPTEDSTSSVLSSGGSSSGRPAGSSTVSAMADANLAAVAIVGVWTLYRPPVVDPNQAPAVSPTPANSNLAGSNPTPTTSPAADLTATESPTVATDKPNGADTEKPTAESPSADDTVPPKTPANPDKKPDSEEKPTAEKPAKPNDETPEKPKPNDDKDE